MYFFTLTYHKFLIYNENNFNFNSTFLSWLPATMNVALRWKNIHYSDQLI